jgi:O-antigen/teichoic acid export membrane protein
MALVKVGVLLVVARSGGPVSVAGLSAFLASVTLVSGITSGGLNLTLISWRERAGSDPDAMTDRLAAAIKQVALLLLPGMVVAFLATSLIIDSSRLYAVVACVAVPAAVAVLVLGALVFSQDDFRSHALGQALGQCVFLGGTATAAFVWPGSAGLLASGAWVLGSVTTAAIWMRRVDLPTLNWRLVRETRLANTFRENVHALAWNVTWAITIRADFYAVGVFLGQRQLGLYALVRSTVDFLLYGTNVMAPIVLRAASKDASMARLRAQTFTLRFGFASLVLAPVVGLLVPIVFGAEFFDVRWLVAGAGFVACAQGAALLTANLLIGEGREGIASRLGLFAMVSTAVVASSLIQVLGLFGALLGAIVGATVSILAVRRRLWRHSGTAEELPST